MAACRRYNLGRGKKGHQGQGTVKRSSSSFWPSKPQPSARYKILIYKFIAKVAWLCRSSSSSIRPTTHTTRDLATTATTYRQQKQHEQKSSFFMKLHISDLYNEDIEAEAKKAASKSSMKISPKEGSTVYTISTFSTPNTSKTPHYTPRADWKFSYTLGPYTRHQTREKLLKNLKILKLFLAHTQLC